MRNDDNPGHSPIPTAARAVRPDEKDFATSSTTQPAKDFHLRWASLTPPQRPPRGIATTMRQLLAAHPGPALQLGVTPEIAHLGATGLAVDWSEPMISEIWPGNTATHHAILGNWLAMPLPTASIGTAYGDACLSMLTWPNDYLLFLHEIQRVLHPGGRLVLRCFTSPAEENTIAHLAAAAFAGRIQNFGAFKLQLNMATFRTAGGTPNTGAHIHGIFQKHFPHRAALAQATGWSLAEIASIDAYADARSVHTYPTRAQLANMLPHNTSHYFVETVGYPLAECCPLLVVDFSANATS